MSGEKNVALIKSCTIYASFSLRDFLLFISMRLSMCVTFSRFFFSARHFSAWSLEGKGKSWMSRGSHRRCSVKKGVFKNFRNFTGKHLCWSLFFNKVAGVRPEKKRIKKRLQHRCFAVKFPKFLRTPILRNICEGLLLNEELICRFDGKFPLDFINKFLRYLQLLI